MSRAVPAAYLGAALLVSGCFVDRSGAAVGQAVDAGDRDARPPPGDGGGVDAGRDDAGPSPCTPGRVDVDGDPANGCECEIADPPTELCNGRDDDCDPDTFDGSGEPTLNDPCDGPDSDQCEEGRVVCNAGSLACSDATDSTPELCLNDIDDDCDRVMDESGAMDARLFYDDDDMDGYGDPDESVRACAAPPGHVTNDQDCDDTTPSINPSMAETCNGRDDDCSGLPDDGSACAGCTVAHRSGRPYLFCTSARSWSGARDHCASFGASTDHYRLVTIEDAGENGWVSSTARGVSGDRFWIGANDRDDEDVWEWVDGSAVGFTSWRSDPSQPDNGGIGVQEDCVEINAWSDASWNDFECDEARAFVCELP